MTDPDIDSKKKKPSLIILDERDKASLKSFPPNFIDYFTCVSHKDPQGLLQPKNMPINKQNPTNEFN